jgi:UDP-glucose 4-epimerase
MSKRNLSGADIVVTGGAGFIGSNLTIDLVGRGADVTVIDNFDEEYGGNTHNLAPVRDDIELITADVRKRQSIRSPIADADIVFHLAAQLSRKVSMESPQRDINTNCRGIINVLETVRNDNPGAKVVFAGSQAQFGSPQETPLTENTPTNPVDIYGADKLAAELYCKIYYESHGIDTTTLRLTNVYGPRSQLDNPNYGVINRFLRLAMENEKLPVFEPGDMKRDPVFVGDVVDAFVSAARTPASEGETFVVGSGSSVTILKLARTITSVVGGGRVNIVPWPEDWDKIRVGDIVVDVSKSERVLGWEPTVSLKDGLKATINYFEKNIDQYI